jgi:predicted Ser/Thr protein kinase
MRMIPSGVYQLEHSGAQAESPHGLFHVTHARVVVDYQRARLWARLNPVYSRQLADPLGNLDQRLQVAASRGNHYTQPTRNVMSGASLSRHRR